MGGDLVPRSLQMAREIRLEGKHYGPSELYRASSGRADGCESIANAISDRVKRQIESDPDFYRTANERTETLEAERDSLLTKEAAEKLRRGIAALIATTYCLKRPELKHEPWDGPCGKCAPCLAKAAYAAAFGEEGR